MPRNVIRWSHEEQQKVAQAAARIRLEQQQGELEAWRLGQQVLPPPRRRKIITISVLSPLTRSIYKQHIQELQKRPKSEPEQPIEPSPPPASAVPTSSLPTTNTVVDDLLEALADAVAEKFVLALKRSFQQQLRELPPDITEHLQSRNPQVRQSKRSLLVVGLLPAQADVVQKRYGDRLDLRFVSSQETPQSISSRAGNSEKILLMTNFINHSHQQAAMQVKGRENVVLVSGGISKLSKELDRL